jgi:hypothetical protein
LQSETVSAGEIFSYALDTTERMSDTYTTVVEPKGQIVIADGEIVVYASNKIVSASDMKPANLYTNICYMYA